MPTYYWHNDVLDGSLNEIKTKADRVTVCAGAPASYAEATTIPAGGKMLAQVGIDTDDFTLASDGASGRKVTLADQTDNSADASGTADHVALVDDGDSRLLCVVPLSASQSVTAGNPCIIQNVILYNRALAAV